jgi:tubulin polyglutamylase TTLL6/13
MYSLTRKNWLAKGLMKMRKRFADEYNFFPLSWVLPSDLNEFKAYSKKKNSIFIVKPEASCQGRGIFLTKSIDCISKSDKYIVQKYLKKPFLIDGLKFDFRIYALIAGCDPLR